MSTHDEGWEVRSRRLGREVQRLEGELAVVKGQAGRRYVRLRLLCRRALVQRDAARQRAQDNEEIAKNFETRRNAAQAALVQARDFLSQTQGYLAIGSGVRELRRTIHHFLKDDPSHARALSPEVVEQVVKELPPLDWKPYDEWGDYAAYPLRDGSLCGVDASNSGDVHSHGIAVGELSIHKRLRAALAKLKETG